MCLQVSRAGHDGLWPLLRGGKPLHHPGEDPHVAPPLPAVAQGLCRAILLGGVPPPQPVAIDEDDPAQDPPVIDTRAASAGSSPRKERLHTRHLLVCSRNRSLMCQVSPPAQHHAHEMKSMGPDPAKCWLWSARFRQPQAFSRPDRFRPGGASPAHLRVPHPWHPGIKSRKTGRQGTRDFPRAIAISGVIAPKVPCPMLLQHRAGLAP